MASVQELLAAADAQQSPFMGLAKGLISGFGQGYEQAPDRVRAILQNNALRQKMANDQAMKDQFAKMTGATEAATQNSLNGVSAPVLPVTPGQRLASLDFNDFQGAKVIPPKPAPAAAPGLRISGATMDDNGPRFTYSATEAKPKALSPREYADAAGKNRIGSFDANTGKVIQSPDDPLAPAPAANLSLGEKQQQYTQKRLTALGDALDPSKARAGAFGVSKQVFDRAERLQSLASAFPDGNLDSRQIEEMAVGLNAMLSGSNTGASSQVSALVPQSIMGNAQKLKEWLLNDPQGTNQQAFVARMVGSVEREKSTASDQIQRTQMQRVARYADLEKSNPDEFYNVLQSAGLDPADYKKWKAGGFKPISAAQRPEGAAPAPAAGGAAHPLVGTKVGQYTITAVQ